MAISRLRGARGADFLKGESDKLESAISVIEELFHHAQYSIFSQRKAADLINQLKLLVQEENKYGGPQSDTSDFYGNLASTAPSSQWSLTHSELVESECPTDNTSILSTPCPITNTSEENLPTESDHDEVAKSGHKPCSLCKTKPL